jgi:hypothetical protein
MNRIIKNRIIYLAEQENEGMTVVKRKRKPLPSIKVGCEAYYKQNIYDNGSIKLKYHWRHKNHDPLEPESFIKEFRLPVEVKKWIIDAVELYKDWKTIKSVLQLTAEELDHVS